MKFASLLCLASLALTAVVAPRPARAEPTSDPDIVRLKDGGLIRGTIQELAPKKYVVIRSATGKTRKIDMKDVEYAGAADPPKADKPYEEEGHAAGEREANPKTETTESDADWVPVKLDADQEGTTFFVKAESGTALVDVDVAHRTLRIGEYQKGCASPCMARIRPGFHHMALTRPGSDEKIDVDRSVQIKEPALLRGHIEMHNGRRALARTLLYGLPVVGLVASGSIISHDDKHVGLALGVFGAGFFGGFVSYLVLMKSPEATISLVPVSLDSLNLEKSARLLHAPLSMFTSPGLVAQGSF